MSKKSRTPKNARTSKTEPTVAVMLTERDLIVLTQDVNEWVRQMSDEVSRDDTFSFEERQWRLEEVVRNGQLAEKLHRASEKFEVTEVADSESRTH